MLSQFAVSIIIYQHLLSPDIVNHPSLRYLRIFIYVLTCSIRIFFQKQFVIHDEIKFESFANNLLHIFTLGSF